ncbi:MAG: hypothetical protein MRJ93_11760 [Nitrososphaeraceae archaeon]|nr:hypothetical protein [Nitrososphaeraceae archaeon]
MNGLREKRNVRCNRCTSEDTHKIRLINRTSEKIMHDNGKQFTSKIFRRFLRRNNIKDKSIPARYPQLQGKIEAYNKIVKNEVSSSRKYS